MNYKTGLLIAPEPPRFRFGSYFVAEELPPVPATFGHYDLIPPQGWGMLGNNTLGDCTVAGAMHAIRLWRVMVNQPVNFTDVDAQEDYFAITGGKDSGADMVQVAKYWQQTGFRDSTGQRHHILAYLQVDPSNLAHIDAACFLFDAVGLGIQVGAVEMREFDEGAPWVNAGYPEGYHYVPMVGKDLIYRKVVTWGGLQDVGEGWLTTSLKEVVAIVTNENLIAGKSLEGFDMDALMADLEAL